VRSGENVLIVEDEDEWSGAYERAVHALGENYTVKIAKDLVSAERLIEATKFAVAFVDVGLDINDDRNVDGLRVMERIRASDDDTSIIVVTGRSGQDVLSITRDAIKKYGAYDTVGKSSVAPADIRRLLEGGLEEYRKAAAAGRRGAHEALRGDAEAMAWDHRLMQAMNFKGNASDFYEFLNRLLGGYLPMVTRQGGGQLDIDASTGLVYGDYWSRAIAAAVAVCFGAAEQFDQAIGVHCTGGRLLGRYEIEGSLKELAGHGVKGAVFALAEGRREDFGENPAE
jgi:ActR/RegA family two-component response regulator